MQDVFDLTGRTALITGASSGLGVVFAEALAAAGARVVVTARRAELLEQTVKSIRAAGGTAHAIAVDVTDAASVRAAYDEAESVFGPVDTIIANAGTSSEAPAVSVEAEEFSGVLDVNVTGAFLTVREGARRLMEARQGGRGRIVLVSSITAVHVATGLAAYSASKAAVLQMGKVLARDWARHGLAVNMLLPGYIETDMNADFFKTAAGEKVRNGFPRRRLLQASDLLPLLLYLSSDAAAAVTGSSFTVDDGQSL